MGAEKLWGFAASDCCCHGAETLLTAVLSVSQDPLFVGPHLPTCEYVGIYT